MNEWHTDIQTINTTQRDNKKSHYDEFIILQKYLSFNYNLRDHSHSTGESRESRETDNGMGHGTSGTNGSHKFVCHTNEQHYFPSRFYADPSPIKWSTNQLYVGHATHIYPEHLAWYARGARVRTKMCMCGLFVKHLSHRHHYLEPSRGTAAIARWHYALSLCRFAIIELSCNMSSVYRTVAAWRRVYRSEFYYNSSIQKRVRAKSN